MDRAFHRTSHGQTPHGLRAAQHQAPCVRASQVATTVPLPHVHTTVPQLKAIAHIHCTCCRPRTCANAIAGSNVPPGREPHVVTLPYCWCHFSPLPPGSWLPVLLLRVTVSPDTRRTDERQKDRSATEPHPAPHRRPPALLRRHQRQQSSQLWHQYEEQRH